ncbi:peptide chain release factor N(5)-glutamine methyltransferase [Desulfonatronum sp. SC1]|uniref:peptide chain release factor N(5)-glutamine methyltransferase n=1 Tax=Desulfonatronum sp. SC1 TaxID=2109626 RepID=UPI000D30A16C|nr:peptide chain release factor N(5)-glutamine methyltransferase [Desulfonatronum sp. SC1]PTN39018.1 peptide chain release factor N(5)-glutamine methyltransferase [Desulfonatronum sp. SC1]
MSPTRPILREILAKSTQFLTTKQVDSPRLSAELVVAHALGLNRLDLFLDLDKPLSEPELARIRPLLKRRGTGEPMAYILERREFYGLDFHVSPEVLIPRPDTELGVELALKLFDREHFFCFADVGTGSGALCVTLLKLFPQARAVATDISSGALNVATGNLRQHGVDQRCLLTTGDLLRHVKACSLDLIVSNLPYIGEKEAKSLSREVVAFEPRLALFGGLEGDELFAPLLRDAQEVLINGGFVLLEVGTNQATSLCDQIQHMSPRWTDIEVHKDLAGHERFVQARLRW